MDKRLPKVQVVWSDDGDSIFAVHCTKHETSVWTTAVQCYGQVLDTCGYRFVIEDNGYMNRRFIGWHPSDLCGKWFIVPADSETEAMRHPVVIEHRVSALRRRGRSFSKAKRYTILERDGFRCRYCGRTVDDGIKLHVDHIVPVSCGGSDEESNLCSSCDDCNLGKGNRFTSAPPGATV
jgi:hypothetical protein